MTELLSFTLYIGALCLYIGVVIPAAVIVYHKAIRRDGMTVKEILTDLNF